MLESAETNEANTTKPAETTVQPMVLETMFDSTPLPDQKSPAGLSGDLKTETALMLCPEDVPDPMRPTLADPVSQDVSPEVKPTDICSNPDQRLTETLMGSRSPIPSPHRGTQPRKRPERYTPVQTDYKCFQLLKHGLDHPYGYSRRTQH